MLDTKDAFQPARSASFFARIASSRAFGLWALVVFTGVVAAGCGTVIQVHNPSPLAKRARWVVLPVTNLADTVQAGERIEALLDPVLREHGVA